MDKKILLGGAAALIMGFGVYATPASAAIEFSYSGEAAITADMSDACSVGTFDLLDSTAVTLALINADADHTGADVDDAQTILDDALKTGKDCGSDTEDNPVWGVTSTWDWAASGTLANGLGLDLAADEVAVSGSFGKFTFTSGGDSAVKAARTNAAGDITVTGDDLGGHTAKTAGTAGVGFLWAAPSVGGADLYVSYSPNSGTDGLTDAEHQDTLGFGIKFATDMLTISAGMENTSGAACATQAANEGGGGVSLVAAAAGKTLKDQADAILVSEACGDETLTALGVSMAAGGLDLNAGWSELDSDGGDKTVMNIGASTALGDYTVGIDYVDLEQTYLFTAAADEQTKLGVNLATNLGAGVDLKLEFSTNDYNVAGTGSHSNYFAQAKLDIVY